MAPSTRIADALPTTLPEDFSEWDGEDSSSASTGSKDLEAIPAIDATLRQPTQSAEREEIVMPSLDKLRDPNPPSPASVSADFNDFLQQEELISGLVNKLHNRAAQEEDAERVSSEVLTAPSWLNVSAFDGTRYAPAFKSTVAPQPVVVPFQPFPSKTDLPKKQWLTDNKRMIVAVACALSILILVLLSFPLRNRGKNLPPHPVQVASAAASSQPASSAPVKSPVKTPAQNKIPTEAEKQVATASQSAQPSQVAKTPQLQTKMMEDQLAAPAQISQDMKRQVAEVGPAPARFDAVDNLGGSDTSVGVFNEHVQPIVKSANNIATPAKPVSIAPAAAMGMLIHKTTPVYPIIAKSVRLSGTVQLRVIIAKNGSVRDLHVLSGPAVLQQSAIDAVWTWRFKPYVLDDEPREVETIINITFSFGA